MEEKNFLEVQPGFQVTIECSEASANPRPRIRWFLNGERINIASDYRYELLRDGSLNILDISATMAGQYMCEASNVVGTSNATVTLAVQGNCFLEGVIICR